MKIANTSAFTNMLIPTIYFVSLNISFITGSTVFASLTPYYILKKSNNVCFCSVGSSFELMTCLKLFSKDLIALAQSTVNIFLNHKMRIHLFHTRYRHHQNNPWNLFTLEYPMPEHFTIRRRRSTPRGLHHQSSRQFLTHKKIARFIFLRVSQSRRTS